MFCKNPTIGVHGCSYSGSNETECKGVSEVATTSKNPYTRSPTEKVLIEAVEGVIPFVAYSMPQALKLTFKD